MTTALFFNVPAYGHVNPSLPLVAELVQRGHRVIFVDTEAFRSTVETLGAEFQPYIAINDDFFDGLDGSRPQKVVCALMVAAEALVPEMLELAQRVQPDYLIYDTACPWGQLAARILKLPAVVSMSLMPIGAPPLSALLKPDMLTTAFSILLTDLDKGIEANQRSRALGKKYNVSPVGPMEFFNAWGDIVISYASAYFQPYADTVPKTVRFVGRVLTDAPADPSFSFERVGGRRLIYVSLGTINNDQINFFKLCIETFAGSDDFIMISTGKRISPDAFGTLPDNIAVYSWVPQLDVLRRAALFVTHSGLGSVHDGLYFGVPMLLVPQQGEQIFIAHRVVELGAGLMLKKTQVTADALRTNATRLLSESRFKTEAVRVGDTFRAAGGAAKGVDEIEAFLRERSALR
jgi:MGT family glycosyltransferase